MSAEPTAEQRLWALTFVTRVLECETPEQIDDTERDLARALAAAVTAERERVIALCLQVMAENESPDDWGVPAVYPSIVARRIREVSR